jgi:polyisoprenoid-binding protein YceI
MNLQDSYNSKTSWGGVLAILTSVSRVFLGATKVNVTVWSRTDLIKASAASSQPRHPRNGRLAPAIALCFASLAWTSAGSAEQRAIDTAKSVMTVHVYKAGVLGALGHDHEIAAPIASGTVDPTGHHVELHTKAGALQVQDKSGSDKDRKEIQKTMLGPEVLDAEKHPEIVFRSTGVESAGAGSWKVEGNLTLHGQTHAVTVEVREVEGRYVGTCRFKQTDFGIKPVKVGGGTIRVKDEIRVEFDIQLAR